MLTVSNYHYIRNHFNAKYPSIFGVTPNKFKEQLVLLKNQGEFINPVNLVKNIDDVLKSKENHLFITFDDGLKEQFDLALPILDELNIPAVFFVNSLNFEEKKVSTVHKIHLLRSVITATKILEEISKIEEFSLLDQEKMNAKRIYRYDDEKSAILKFILNFKLNLEQQEVIIKKLFDFYFEENKVLESLYMSENNLKELAKLGYLGSHTHSHLPIGLLGADKIKFELENTRLFFEELTNAKLDLVSYPYGTPEVCTDEVATLAKKAGYKLGFTTNRKINTAPQNHLLLHRFDCNDLIGGKNFNK